MISRVGLCGLWLGLAIGSPVAEAECKAPSLPDAGTLEMWAANTAHVLSARSNHGNGLGLVVAWGPKEIWVAVPDHVVFGIPLPSDVDLDEYAAGLSVTLFDFDRPSNLCSKDALTQPGGPAGDLVFICLERDERLVLFVDSLAGAPQVGDQVALLGDAGRPGKASGVVGEIATIVPTVPTDSRADILANGLRGVPTQSGAAAYTHRGIVGIYTGRALGRDGYILSLAAIRKWLVAADLDFRWSLVEMESYDCRLLREVCPQAAEASIDLKLTRAFTNDLVKLPAGSCAWAPEGRYLVEASSPGYRCEPATLLLRQGEAALRPNITCRVDLGGRWHSRGGELNCTEYGVGVFTCQGLGDLGIGYFEATVSPRGAHIEVRGSFRRASGWGASEVSGRFGLTSAGRLVGHLEFDIGVPKIELEFEKEK